jgi:hypothetical protein
MTSIIKVNTIQDAGGNALLTSDGSGSITTNNIGGQNTPAFEAQGSAETTGVSDNTWTKVIMNTEVFDTAGAYDHSSNYRFTPQVAGKYYVYGGMAMYSQTSDKLQIANLSIYKNGSNYKYIANNFSDASEHNEAGLVIATTVVMNGSSDYVELYARGNVTAGDVTFEPQNTLGVFGAYKIIE